MLTSSFPRWPGDQTCDYLRQFAERLSDQVEVTVLTPASAGAPDRERWAGVTVIRFHYVYPRRCEVLSSGRDDWATLRRSLVARLVLGFYLLAFFRQAVRRGREADVLLSHWLVPSGVIGAAVAWWLGKPHLVIEHSGALRLLQRLPGGQRLLRCVVRGSRRLITVSQELRQRLIEHVPEAAGKVTVLSMGVNLSGLAANREPHPDRHCLPNGRRIVLYLGRLAEVKGVEYVIQAMVGIDRAVLVIAGDGECEGKLRRLAERLNLPAIFLGRVDARQKWWWLGRCDVVVVPSVVLSTGRTEGIPLVCLEALSAGKPVIASRVGGLPEVIRQGVNGVLVEPANVGQLRSALSRLLSAEPLRQRIGRRARASAQDYDWGVMGERFAQLICQAINEDHCQWPPPSGRPRPTS